MTITTLRKDIYRIFNEIAKTGNPVEINRNGVTIKIIREELPGRLERLKNPPTKVCKGNSDDLISIDWSSEWKEGSI